jgi:hypothetical protein
MIWQRRCEASEDIKALGSVLKAGRHWKTLLCGKCLKSWKNYVILSKQRRIQWLSASRIYSTRVLTACFGAWLDYVEVERVEQKHVGIAVDFRRLALGAVPGYRIYYQLLDAMSPFFRNETRISSQKMLTGLYCFGGFSEAAIVLRSFTWGRQTEKVV